MHSDTTLTQGTIDLNENIEVWAKEFINYAFSYNHLMRE